MGSLGHSKSQARGNRSGCQTCKHPEQLDANPETVVDAAEEAEEETYGD
ncbi:MAG: hypothetical protein ACT4R6_03590 [Gemmatimonadaceae bacterium]